ncbi:GNAT family N-acetyltransferase [Pseudoxanthomonas daejeonensis]|uniref:N-acetyltransferase n=1 Tax=Pseudoxanthomonas daejeonensis TaxID=266062 RepID=A0ABQ6Z906_9GAMM|nr:GNAT family N-acetyltransferase [Pseudoxanthomonas daejeonensis]KAF1695938.1 N-acetyltransferase [Pseudoxanthomonas daejeonensis]UNK57625.1 GNAT family N-acetyltransferase [Pseudoxanthomonas daejeonensis]
MPRNRLPPWHEEFVLPNRRAILIRPIRPEDAAPLQGMFGMLGPAELRGLFSDGQEALDDATATQLARPDPKVELVLVGAEPLPPGEAMIAGLARARIVPGTRQAEYAILLGNYVAGLGLGRHLMQKLVKWSRGRYLDRLYGDTPDSNGPMLDLAASMGFRPSLEAGVPPGLTRLVLDLDGS